MSRAGQRKPGSIYLIRPRGMHGPIKIGFSALPSSRLYALAAWSPFPLEIVAQFPGTFALEQNLHACLAGSHSHHEWFHPTPKVLGFVAAILAGKPVEDAIDLSAREGRPPRKPWSEESRIRANFAHRLRFKPSASDDVKHIMSRWSGYGRIHPTAEEMLILERELPGRLRAPHASAAPTPERCE